jgi:hypothetical protein
VGAYSTAEWSDFLVAAAGATAALAGLLFVGVSINLSRILQYEALPDRAGQTLLLLGNALAATLLLLGPPRHGGGLGLQVLLVGIAGWTAAFVLERRADRHEPNRIRRIRWGVCAHLATLPFVIGGLSLLASAGGGLYWVQAGVVMSLLVGLLNAWVLLVEILR